MIKIKRLKHKTNLICFVGLLIFGLTILASAATNNTINNNKLGIESITSPSNSKKMTEIIVTPSNVQT